MSELSGHIDCLARMRDETDDVNEAVALDAAVQAMDILEKVKGENRLRSELEKQFGGDIWPA